MTASATVLAPAAKPAPPEAPKKADQRTVLADRYLECVLGDPGTLLLLVGQAPFIGYLCTLVWGSVETDTPSLYFVMCLASVWFGCVGACREIVKERAIIERERLLGIRPMAVVLSKAEVLFGIAAAQAILLQMAVHWKLALKGPFLVHTVALVLAAWCGVGLGLVVSVISTRQDRAVGAVPLLLLPQVLFSEIAVPRQYFTHVVSAIEKLMPVRWAYRVFVDLAEPERPWWTILGSLGALAVYAAVLLLIATAALQSRREI
jgi:ABC-type multidrug transport system permease subunit